MCVGDPRALMGWGMAEWPTITLPATLPAIWEGASRLPARTIVDPTSEPPPVRSTPHAPSPTST